MGQPVTLMGEARTKNSFVSAADVAAYAVAAVEHPVAVNRFLVISGPQALCYRDVVGVYERVLGRSIPVNFVPLGEPLPGLPPTMSAMLAGMDFDAIVDLSETARNSASGRLRWKIWCAAWQVDPLTACPYCGTIPPAVAVIAASRIVELLRQGWQTAEH